MNWWVAFGLFVWFMVGVTVLGLWAARRIVGREERERMDGPP